MESQARRRRWRRRCCWPCRRACAVVHVLPGNVPRQLPDAARGGRRCLLLGVNGHEHLGYLLGFHHLTFYANGPVAWVEEIAVRGTRPRPWHRQGFDERIGRASCRERGWI